MIRNIFERLGAFCSNPLRSGRDVFIFLMIAFLFSALTVAIIYPELFVFHSRSFMWQHDTGIPFENTFTLLSNFYNGGIQLFNRYDQMSCAYSHLTSGLYTLSNIITAAIYLLFAPLFDHQGEAYHAIYARSFHLVNILIRAIGGFLLLTRFRLPSGIILISLVYLNTLLASPLYDGLLTNTLYSYLPLILYFILRFFEEPRLNVFLAFLLGMTLSVANSPLFALGYFYQIIHFFIIVCLVFFVSQIRKWPTIQKVKITSGQMKKAGIVFGVCLLLILPSIYLMSSLKTDFYLKDSGLGETTGRMNQKFGPSGYFQAQHQFAPLKDFISRSLNCRDNLLSENWPFLGATTLLLSLLAILFSKNKLKHIFLWTFIGILSLNTPSTAGSPLALGHWINALTNPFSFLLRSIHMTDLLAPFLLMPLIGLGLQNGFELAKGQSAHTHTDRILIGILIFLAVTALFTFYLPAPLNIYGAGFALIFLVFLCVVRRVNSSTNKWVSPITVLVFFLLFIFDLSGQSYYVKHDSFSNYPIKPSTYAELNSPQQYIFDYQNPAIMPWREYYRPDMNNLPFYSLQNSYGLFYHFTQLGRYLNSADIYRPRPIAYKNLNNDIYMILRYTFSDQQMFFWTPYALPAQAFSSGKLPDAVGKRQLILVDNPGTALKPIIPPASGEQVVTRNYQINEFPVSLANARVYQRGPYREYMVDLPKNFPDYLSTTVFTNDRENLGFLINGQNFSPVQGKLLEPFTFDVQNIKTGKLAFLVPADVDLKDKKAALFTRQPRNLKTIWLNQHDQWGITYVAPADGWLTFHYPYDPKWQASIDNQPVKIYRVNKYFMGFPIDKGDHRILLRYWPDTPLRIFIVISMILTVVVFVGLVGWGIRTESGLKNVNKFKN